MSVILRPQLVNVVVGLLLVIARVQGRAFTALASGMLQPTESLKEGDTVIVVEECETDSESRISLEVGERGQVLLVDDDGDAQVDFAGRDTNHRIQWITSQKFKNFKKTDEEENSDPVSDMFGSLKAFVDGITGSSDNRTGPLLFIGVITAPGNVANRKEIRETWFRHELLTMTNPLVEAKFIVGMPEPGSSAESVLALDMEINSDILQLYSFEEDYHNLNQKSVAYFRWFADHSKAEFAMKLDDDTFPNLDRITSILNTKVANEKRYTYLGNMLVNRRPMDHGKWKQNPAVYSEEFYPKYAAGPGYILRSDLVKVVFKDGYDENMKQVLDNEDANTGLWVSKANLSGSPVDYQHMDANEEKCMPKDTIAMNLELGAMSCMWGRKVDGEADICCGHEKYDWRARADDLQEQASFLRRRAEEQGPYLRGRTRQRRSWVHLRVTAPAGRHL